MLIAIDRGGSLHQVAITLQHITSWPGNRIALTYAGSPRRSLRLIHGQTAAELRIALPEDLNGGGIPTPCPLGERFYTGYDDLWVLQARAGEHAIRLPYSRRPANFSPKGLRIATSTGFGVTVWSTETGSAIHNLADVPHDESHLTALIYSPDGRRLATGWNDGTIRIHDTDADSGRLLLSFPAHRLRVRSLSYSPDGHKLLSCSHDGTARVWNSRDGRQELIFRPGAPCNDARFAPRADSAMVTCDRAIHIFPLNPRSLAERACPRNLTAAERRRFGL